MSDPLDDFNKCMTVGSSSWMMGAPKNTAESAAQSLIDAQQPRTQTAGGGSIDFGIKPCAIILLSGIAFYTVGSYLIDNFREATAMTGLLILIISGFSLLIGGGGLVVGCLKSLGSAGLAQSAFSHTDRSAGMVAITVALDDGIDNCTRRACCACNSGFGLPLHRLTPAPIKTLHTSEQDARYNRHKQAKRPVPPRTSHLPHQQAIFLHQL